MNEGVHIRRSVRAANYFQVTSKALWLGRLRCKPGCQWWVQRCLTWFRRSLWFLFSFPPSVCNIILYTVAVHVNRLCQCHGPDSFPGSREATYEYIFQLYDKLYQNFNVKLTFKFIICAVKACKGLSGCGYVISRFLSDNRIIRVLYLLSDVIRIMPMRKRIEKCITFPNFWHKSRISLWKIWDDIIMKIINELIYSCEIFRLLLLQLHLFSNIHLSFSNSVEKYFQIVDFYQVSLFWEKRQRVFGL